MTEERRARLYVVASMLGFAVIGVLSREAHTGFLTVSFYRAAFVAVSFLVLYLAREGPLRDLLPTRERFLKFLLPYGLAVAAASTTIVGGYIFTSYPNTLFLHNLAPLFVFALCGPFFREKPRPAEIAGALLGIAGVACISGVSMAGFLTFADGRVLLGDGMALFSALAYALVLIYTRLVQQAKLGLYSTLFWMWVVAAAAIGVPNVAWGSFAAGGRSLLWIFLLALLCTTLPFVLLNLGMRKIHASEGAILALTEVLFGLILAWMIYHDTPSILALLGGGLIVAGLVAAREDDTAPTEPDGPLLAALGVHFVLLDVLVAAAVVERSPVAAAACAVAVAGGVALLQASLERRWPGRISQASAATGALVAVAALAVAEARALHLAPDAGTAPAAALGTLVLATVGFAWMRRRFIAARDPRLARLTGMAAAGLGAAAAAQLLAMTGLALAAPGYDLLAVPLAGVIAVEAFGPALAAVLPAGGRRLALLTEKRLLDRRFVQWTAAALALAYVGSGFFIVEPQQQAVVQIFGCPRGRALDAGLHYVPPYPIGRVSILDALRPVTLQLSGGAVGGLNGELMLTGDVNVADVQAEVEYRVQDPNAYLFGVTDPVRLIRAAGESTLRGLVAGAHLDALLVSLRERLQERARAALQAHLDAAGAGVAVTAFRILDTHPPAAVMGSFLDVVSAAEDKNTAINQAYAYGASALPEARGTRQKMLRDAEADALTGREHALGEAAAFVAEQAAYAGGRALTSFRLYVETVETALAEVDKYLVDPGLSVQFRYKNQPKQGETK